MAIQKLNIHVTPGQKARASDFNAATGKIDEVIDALNNGERTIENVVTELSNKQETLTSGENIKTINGQSVLGEGDIVVKAPMLHFYINPDDGCLYMESYSFDGGEFFIDTDGNLCLRNVR